VSACGTQSMAYPRGISLALEMDSHRVFICLGLSAVAWPSTIGAQSLPAPAGTAQSPNVLAARTYSCVDASDALARMVQAEPCRWPKYELPSWAGSGSGEPPRLPKIAPKSTGPEAHHAMFWRFPVQPRGPYDAPRHTWR